MSITGKVSICNLTLQHLGNYGTVANIDQPVDSKEITFAIWYDITRQAVLKASMPNFALDRAIVAQTNEVPLFGYSRTYQLPPRCLKVLGIGNAYERENNYGVEGNRILTDEDYTGGLPVRFIKDVDDVGSFSPEFIMLFSLQLAANVALTITQDVQKSALALQKADRAIISLGGINAQENRPERISRSRFRQGRWGGIMGGLSGGSKK